VNAALCGALAVVSFEFFEKPILNMKRFFPATSTRRPATPAAPVTHRLPVTLSPELRA
jgi:peptidoglycan/LPS O-acetylase OafA/YrhL